MKYVILYMGSLALAGVGAWVIFRWGPVLGVLDSTNHRSSHEGVIPKGGGIGDPGRLFAFCLGVRSPASVLGLRGDHCPFQPLWGSKGDIDEGSALCAVCGGDRGVGGVFRSLVCGVLGEDVYLAMGQTMAGRYVSVLFVYKLTKEVLIMSARDMARKEGMR